MRLPKLIRWLIWIAAGMFALVLIFIALLSFVRIPLDLTGQKDLLEWTASRALGRRVAIDRKVILSTSLWPDFQIEGLRLGNPDDFDDNDFAVMKSARISVGVLPLLKWNVNIREFTVTGVTLSLMENSKRKVNWSPHVTDKPTASVPSKGKEKKPERDLTALTSDAFVLEKLLIEDIAVSYMRPDLDAPLEIRVDQCKGSALVGKPFTLSAHGQLFNESFKASVKSGSLKELLEENRSWTEIQIDVAKTRFKLAGALDLSHSLRQIDLTASVEGAHLNSLNGLFKLDLPPFTSYQVKARLTGRKDRIDITDLEIRVAESTLTGKMVIEKTGSRSVAAMDLISLQIQLNDFIFDNWSWEYGSKDEASIKQTAIPQKDAAGRGGNRDTTGFEVERIKKILNHDFIAGFDARITIKAENVLSGADKLGSGLMTVALKEGRFSIDPLKINVPGGSLSLGLSFEPGVESSDAAFRVLMENFDFGILARRTRPETDMGGKLNLDINLKSKAQDFKGLLKNANGYMDFSGTPENLRAGILDFWAVNLIAAITASAESKNKEQASRINCVVCRWGVKDGIIKPDAFVIDISRIRICGEGKVDLNEETIDLIIAPTPKKPAFFSLATPLAVKGTFADFKMGIRAGGLIGTTIQFITSPFVVPLARILSKGLPEDGKDVCPVTIGPDNRPVEPLPGCVLLKPT